MKYTFELGQHGPHLWTRELAKKIRPSLVALLDASGEGDVLVINLHGVEVFDFSFANELFGRTLLSLPDEYAGRILMVENLTPYTRENLEKALADLQLAVIERRGKELKLLGKVHPADEATFATIAKSKAPATAASLKDALDVNLTAMNERLSKLTRLGLVWRKKAVSAAGREQYEYVVPG